ncbi:MAG: NAD-dependent deacetylase [Actinomycetota bacterium]|nr:NAD-dependent deacetylase [Actinomycetota bacterium]
MVADDFRRAHGLVGRATRIVVLSGAGISTDSGIPDFRGPNGLWAKDPGAERRATLAAYLSDPELRSTAWQRLADRSRPDPVPNAGHRALVGLEDAGRLELLATQNTDGLHLAAGHHPERVVELHGSSRRTRCWRCGVEQDTDRVLERVRAGETDPCCTATIAGAPCGGLLKRSTILFGEPLDAAALRRAALAVRDADLLMAVGTTLSVHPAAGLVHLAHELGRPIVILTRGPTELDHLASARLDGSISELLPALCA